MKKIILLAFLAAICLVTGCATGTNGFRRSTPVFFQGADPNQILLQVEGGKEQAVTPCFLRLPNERVQVKASANGYKDAVIEFVPSANMRTTSCLLVDTAACIIPPAGVTFLATDFLTGNWREHEKSFTISLEKKPVKAKPKPKSVKKTSGASP